MLRLLTEFVRYARDRKAYWLLPLAVALGIVFLLGALSASSPLAPFVYPLF